MPVYLTDDQKREFDRSNGRTVVIHPDTGAEYVLVPAADLQTLIEDAEDQRERRAWAEVAHQALVERYKDDPWPQ